MWRALRGGMAMRQSAELVEDATGWTWRGRRYASLVGAVAAAKRAAAKLARATGEPVITTLTYVPTTRSGRAVVAVLMGRGETL